MSSVSVVSGSNINYQVEKGDTFSAIALRFGVKEVDLKNANPNIINPNFVKAGSKLIIPGFNEYNVKDGETLWGISRKLKTDNIKISVDDLKKINNLKSDVIKENQILYVPNKNNQKYVLPVKPGVPFAPLQHSPDQIPDNPQQKKESPNNPAPIPKPKEDNQNNPAPIYRQPFSPHEVMYVGEWELKEPVKGTEYYKIVSIPGKISQEGLKLAKAVDAYLNRSVFTDKSGNKPRINGLHVVSASEQTGIPVAFILANAQFESRFLVDPNAVRGRKFNSVFSMGNWDNGENKYSFQTPNHSIYAFCELINKNYLVNGKTIEHLLVKFINKNNYRYARDPNREADLRVQIPKIEKFIKNELGSLIF